MCSKCPELDFIYVEYKWLGQRQKCMTAVGEKNTYCIGGCEGVRSNEVKDE